MNIFLEECRVFKTIRALSLYMFFKHMNEESISIDREELANILKVPVAMRRNFAMWRRQYLIPAITEIETVKGFLISFEAISEDQEKEKSKISRVIFKLPTEMIASKNVVAILPSVVEEKTEKRKAKRWGIF